MKKYFLILLLTTFMAGLPIYLLVTGDTFSTWSEPDQILVLNTTSILHFLFSKLLYESIFE
jgi:hypothetical protein